MNIEAIKVIGWIEKNLPPLSWSLIKVHNMKTFISNDVQPLKITQDTKFNQEIIQTLKAFIRKKYSAELPF